MDRDDLETSKNLIVCHEGLQQKKNKSLIGTVWFLQKLLQACQDSDETSTLYYYNKEGFVFSIVPTYLPYNIWRKRLHRTKKIWHIDVDIERYLPTEVWDDT